MENHNVLLKIDHISKSFPGVKALNDVSFSIDKGEIRALCGENGAGKSTLIKILTGIYTKDEGDIFFDGEKTELHSPKDAQRIGISTVYQELNLIPYLTVAENIFLGDFPMGRTGINWKETRKRAEQLLGSLNLDIDPGAVLNTLGAASQQMVAIARALREEDCRMLILDEPTSSLDKGEVALLFTFLENLKKRGVTLVFITHRLEEIYQICDSITVLKDGSYVGTYTTEELNQHKLVECMIGREMEAAQEQVPMRRKIDRTGHPVLEVRHMKASPVVKDMNLSIYPGEIVGLAGLLGSGRTETARAICGCDKVEEGTILMDGKKVKITNPVHALKNRIAMCTENRRADGIVPDMEVKNNAVLSSLDALSRFGMINSKKRSEKVKYYVEKFNIKTPTINQKIKFLSGGNQQKVLLARALISEPKLIILDEPTRGIDVGAKAEIESLIHEVAGRGIGVLFISSELPEVIRNSDRVVVVRDGCSVGELEGEEIRMENITEMIAAQTQGR